MEASFVSFVAAAALLVSTAASAAPIGDNDRDLRHLSSREWTRVEQAQRARERQQAIARAGEPSTATTAARLAPTATARRFSPW